MTLADYYKFLNTLDEIPESDMFTGWQTSKRTCCSRHIGFTLSRSQDLCYTKYWRNRRNLSSSFSTDHKERRFLWQASWDLFDAFGVASLFCFDCLFFPTVACFTVPSCAQLILGKFLIVHRYSALKSARDLLDYFFFWFILFAWHFRASNAPLWCSPLSTLLWNWHDWNLHA